MADGEAADAAAVSREVQRMNNKVYEYESLIYSAGENGRSEERRVGKEC